jgi:hypothetical protein
MERPAGYPTEAPKTVYPWALGDFSTVLSEGYVPEYNINHSLLIFKYLYT